ncbi:MAG: primosome assembly protein PriA, partial [Nakamurella sp.]
MTSPPSGAGRASGVGARAAAAKVAGPSATAKKPRKAAALPAPKQPAEVLPVATVAVDISLSHLDRPFDYLVPADLGETAQPGTRVRVRFAGRLVDGFVLHRLERSEHGGRLGYLERVVSPEPVLTAEILALARAVADRYVGSMSDVLRLAIPPRHARAEASVPAAAQRTGDRPEVADPEAVADATEAATELPADWSVYPAGAAFLTAVTRGAAARAVWQPVPGEDWPVRLAELATAVEAAGRGVLLLVPDARDLARLQAALAQTLPADRFVTLSADLGPAERYRRFLTVRRGLAKVVAGTRAAAFAPVAELALTVIFDDGDELFAEPRAPYPHAREVLMMRSAAAGCALLVGGFSRTAEAQLLVESGWAKELVAGRQTVRSRMPRIQAQGDSYAVGADSAVSMARLSPAAFAAARAAIAADTAVLVQVPRRGYLDAL